MNPLPVSRPHAAARVAAALLLALAIGAGPASRAHAADAPAGVWAHATLDSAAGAFSEQWTMHVTVHNGSAFGVYVDSLRFGFRAADGSGTPTSMPIHPSTDSNVRSIGAGEEQLLQFALPAGRVDSRVVLEMFAHAMSVPMFVLRDSLTAPGHDLTRLFPGTLAHVHGRTVELTRLAPAETDANGVGVLLLRDEGSDAGDDLATALALTRSGFTVVVVAPPGTGRSQGPADACGPASLAAAAAGLDSLRASPGVDGARLAALGSGGGGTLAFLLGWARPEVRAVVAVGASYDPWATSRALPAAARAAYVAAAGRDSAAWRQRSLLAAATTVPVAHQPAMLVLHGEADALAPAAAAHAFVARLHERQVPVESNFFPKGGHDLPKNAVLGFARRFITRSTTGARQP